jgi:hypothetical protein
LASPAHQAAKMTKACAKAGIEAVRDKLEF